MSKRTRKKAITLKPLGRISALYAMKANVKAYAKRPKVFESPRALFSRGKTTVSTPAKNRLFATANDMPISLCVSGNASAE